MRTTAARPPAALEVFLAFLRLGLTSFGGPVAHLGYFRQEFVERRAWLGDRAYADLVALCQFLPGPASSQVGMAIGMSRAGYPGALAAWVGFTAPSAAALVLFALALSSGGGLPRGALAGLRIVAVAIVAQAVWGMARTLCADARRATVMGAAACAALLAPPWGQVAVIAAAGVAGLAWFDPQYAPTHEPLPIPIGPRAGIAWLALFAALLIALPLASSAMPGGLLAKVDAFFRAGSLVFGGGHVVLPLLQAELVPRGWIGDDAFMAGYGATQAMPGPLFAFAAFLGAAMEGPGHGWVGGLTCLAAIFAPSFLLVMGALPFWERLRGDDRARAALAGINAGVVGLLLAALYTPVWTSAVHAPRDFALAIAAAAALAVWKVPPWIVVCACATTGWLLRF